MSKWYNTDNVILFLFKRVIDTRIFVNFSSINLVLLCATTKTLSFKII